MSTNFKILKNFANVFKFKNLLRDIYAACCVTIISIPLCLATAIACNVPITMVFISAIAGGVISSILSSNKLSISGPAIAMSVIVSQTNYIYGIESVVLAGIVCGILQLASGIFNLGNYSKFIPKSIVYAFISSIGTIIIFNQFLHIQNIPHLSLQYFNLFDIVKYYNLGDYKVTFILLLTIFLLIILPIFINLVISALISIIIPSLIVYVNHWHQFKLVGDIHLIPPVFNLNLIHSYHNLYYIILSGFAIFIISSLETLLSSIEINKISNNSNKYNPNRELISNGLANIVTSLLGGIPLTTLITRSQVNIESGGKSRLSVLIYAIFLFLIFYYFKSILSNIPITVLSSILIVAGIRMINFSNIYSYFVNDKLDFLIFFITYITILFSDFVSGLKPILILAFILIILKTSANKFSFKLSKNNEIVRIGLNGSISFSSFQIFTRVIKKIQKFKNVKVVIFEFEKVNKIDSMGVNNLIEETRLLYNCGVKVIFHGGSDILNKKITESVYHEQFYIFTITEHDIQNELQKWHIDYHTIDVIKNGIYKFNLNYINNNKSLINKLSKGQNPHSLLITCSDSRLTPNDFFSSNAGEIFTIRNVGNIIPKYNLSNTYSEIAAIEFALIALKIRNIIICAHTECGAVKSSIDNLEISENTGLSKWLEQIKCELRKHGKLTYDEGVQQNLITQIENLKTYPIIIELLAKNQLTFIALIYDINTASMFELDQKEGVFNKI